MAELLVPSVDFSSLGQLPQIYRQNQADALRRQTLANLGQGGAVDAQTLLRSGDLSLAQLGVNMQNREADRARQAAADARQAARDKVTDSHWAASHDLARRAAARADETKPVFKEITDPNTGATSIVAIDPKALTARPLDTGITPASPNNPFSAGGKFNEGQGKAAGFTDRMLQSEGILSGFAPDGGIGPPSPGVQMQGASVTQSGLSKVPGAGNFLVSNDRQKFEQAKRDFINAQLRRESGAAISPTEFESADKQYFPVPGDRPEVIQQKAANRRAAIQALGREGGPSYRPSLNFNQEGTVTSYGQSAPKNTNAPDSAFPPPPKVGETRGGYRFRGGNPGDPANWAKVSG